MKIAHNIIRKWCAYITKVYHLSSKHLAIVENIVCAAVFFPDSTRASSEANNYEPTVHGLISI